MKLFITTIVSLLIISESFAIENKNLIGTTWELIDITGVSLYDCPPQGFAARKEYFKDDKTMYVIDGDKKLTDKSTAKLSYKLKDNQITVSLEGKELYKKKLIINSKGQLISYTKESEKWTYNPLKGKEAYNQEIEPKSVAVILGEDSKEQLSCYDVKYDKKDYSKLPISERILGIWEVVSVKNYPEMPPFGVPNYKYIFTPEKKFYMLEPHATNLITPKLGTFTVEKNELKVHANGREMINKVSFNKWGFLELDYNSVITQLKLVTKDCKKIQKLPTKTALLIK